MFQLVPSLLTCIQFWIARDEAVKETPLLQKLLSLTCCGCDFSRWKQDVEDAHTAPDCNGSLASPRTVKTTGKCLISHPCWLDPLFIYQFPMFFILQSRSKAQHEHAGLTTRCRDLHNADPSNRLGSLRSDHLKEHPHSNRRRLAFPGICGS